MFSSESVEQRICTSENATRAGINNLLEKNPPVPIGAAPIFDRNGEEVRLSDYKGTPLVMNFWATWCAPCVAEMPALDRMKGLLADSGIDVLAINEDRDGAAMAAKFYETNKIRNLDILIDRKMALIKAAKVAGLPTTFLIDAEGNEVASVIGETAWDTPEVIGFVKTCLLPSG